MDNAQHRHFLGKVAPKRPSAVGAPKAQNLLTIGAFPLKLPENMILKKSWGQGGPGPPGPLDPQVNLAVPATVTLTAV